MSFGDREGRLILSALDPAGEQVPIDSDADPVRYAHSVRLGGATFLVAITPTDDETCELRRVARDRDETALRMDVFPSGMTAELQRI